MPRDINSGCKSFLFKFFIFPNPSLFNFYYYYFSLYSVKFFFAIGGNILFDEFFSFENFDKRKF